jgi:aerobic C4-dicarboxylate transport protein
VQSPRGARISEQGTPKTGTRIVAGGISMAQGTIQAEPERGKATLVQKPKKPFYKSLWGQVLVALGIAIVLGYLNPDLAVQMRPLGDAFIRLISMVISLVIAGTIVTGIAGMGDLKKIGRVGGKAILYFEVVSTIALLCGLIVGNLFPTGTGFDVDVSTVDTTAVTNFAGQARSQSVSEFLLQIIPATVIDAFARGNILAVVLVSLLFGLALAGAGPRVKPLVELVDALMIAVFRVVNILMLFAPIGAFGAMAFTIGRYGLTSLGPLIKLILTFWALCFFFVFVILGAISWMAGFSIFKFVRYIKEEIVLVLSLSSSEPVLPSVMAKLERLGCSKALVGLVMPTGFTFNTDGSCLYMTLAALFVAQATNTPLTLTQQLTIFGVAMLTSKGATGVQGASFIALVGTLMVVPAIPVAGMALILGIDRFMSMFRGSVNVIGNGVATLVIARWERELKGETLRNNLA